MGISLEVSTYLPRGQGFTSLNVQEIVGASKYISCVIHDNFKSAKFPYTTFVIAVFMLLSFNFVREGLN